MPVRDASVFGPSWHEIEHGRPRRAEPWWRDERERLLALAAQGTPAYVYHLPTLRERARSRSEEHTSELQSLMRSSYAVFCLKKKTYHTTQHELTLEHV